MLVNVSVCRALSTQLCLNCIAFMFQYWSENSLPLTKTDRKQSIGLNISFESSLTLYINLLNGWRSGQRESTGDRERETVKDVERATENYI